MATSNWNLSAGADFDFSGNKEVRESNKRFADAQRIIADAYKLDETAATQDLRIDAINTKNREYVDDVAAQNELRKLLADDQTVDEQQQAVEADLPIIEDKAASQDMTQQDGTQSYEKQAAEAGMIERATSPGQSTTQRKLIKPEQTIQRRATMTERIDRALAQTSNPRVRLKLEDMKQAEIVKTAASLSTTDPIAALKVLRENGNQYVPELRRTSTGYKQILPDNREMDIDDLQAAFLVGDFIKGSNDRMKYVKEVQAQKAKEQADDRKSARDQAERLQLEAVKFKFGSALEEQKQLGKVDLQNARGGKYARQIIGYDGEGNAVFGAGGSGGGGGRGAGDQPQQGVTGGRDSFVTGQPQQTNAKPQAAGSLELQIAAISASSNIGNLEKDSQILSAQRKEINSKNPNDPRLSQIDKLKNALDKKIIDLRPKAQADQVSLSASPSKDTSTRAQLSSVEQSANNAESSQQLETKISKLSTSLRALRKGAVTDSDYQDIAQLQAHLSKLSKAKSNIDSAIMRKNMIEANAEIEKSKQLEQSARSSRIAKILADAR